MMRRAVLGVLACVLAVSGCGGGVSHPRPQPAAAPAAHHAVSASLEARLCPPGQSQMGCAVLPTATAQPKLPHSVLAGAPKFPDVSVWQGAVDWPAVAAWQRAHGWHSGGIFKMGEYTADREAAHNSAGTSHLFWRGGYWFVRNTGCQHEADQIIGAARAYGLHVVWLDLEVREAAGYGRCLSPPLRHAGLIVGEYTSPGSNPGGVDTSDPLWEATFGSGFTPIWHPVVAWQCTDGQFGCVTFIPGIGHDDVSLDLGISKLGGPPPPPPDPFAVLQHVVRHFGNDHAVEYKTAKTWKTHGCREPVRRGVCRSSRAHLVLLTGRLWFVAHHPLHAGRASWGVADRGERFKIMRDELHQH